jgi:enoyl-CoA hydratase/carnithine racemase
LASDEIIYSAADGIATVTFNRPQARNALTFAMYDEIARICEELVATNSAGISALIFTGAGDRAFAAGTDISGFRDFSSAQDAIDYESRMDEVLTLIESVPIPTIAAIQGACTGGGAAIAACCDLRVGNGFLKFGFPIARTLGNCLSATSLARLSALMGAARTKEIIFTSRLIQSYEALATGLLSEVTDEPLKRAQELAEQMKGHAPITMRVTKEALRRLREHSSGIEDHDLIEQAYTSNDFREGLEAFLAKRTPQWTGT